jgi:hypothetical protein
MEARTSPKEVSPQFREILRFQSTMSQRSGRQISLSEAIAGWIALGLAEDFRENHYHLSH